MKEALKRSIAIILIICLAIAVGKGVEQWLSDIEKSKYPLLYCDYVEKYAKLYDVPEEVVYAVIKTESNFIYNAISSAGAGGLMQLMPDTYKWISEKLDLEYNETEIYDTEKNIMCGVYYISYLKNRFVIWDTAFAAYNAGPNRVDEWLDNSDYAKNGILTNIPVAETKEYVSKVNSAMEMYKEILSEKQN